MRKLAGVFAIVLVTISGMAVSAWAQAPASRCCDPVCVDGEMTKCKPPNGTSGCVDQGIACAGGGIGGGGQGCACVADTCVHSGPDPEDPQACEKAVVAGCGANVQDLGPCP